MNFTIPADVLLRAARLAKKTSGKFGPQLGVLFQGGGSKLVLTSGDGTLALRQTLDVPSVGQEMVVPAEDLARAAEIFTGEVTAKLHAEKKRWVLTSAGKRRAELPIVLAPDRTDAPRFPNAPDKARTLYANALRTAIERTRCAVSSDAARPHLCQMHLEFCGEALRAAATNGKFMVVYGDLGPQPDDAVGVPAAMFAPLLALLPAEGTVRFAWNGTTMVVDGEGWSVAHGLMEAKFPGWRFVLDGASNHKITLRTEAAELAREVKAASTLARASSALIAEIDDGTIGLCGDGDDGQSASELDVELTPRFAKLRIGISADQTLDVLGSLPPGPIEVGFGAELDPYSIVPGDKSGVAILMPWRV